MIPLLELLNTGCIDARSALRNTLLTGTEWKLLNIDPQLSINMQARLDLCFAIED